MIHNSGFRMDEYSSSPLSHQHIKSHQVTSSHIKSHQVTSSHIKSHQVTSSPLSHQVTSSHIKSHQVTSSHISSPLSSLPHLTFHINKLDRNYFQFSSSTLTHTHLHQSCLHNRSNSIKSSLHLSLV